MTSSNAPGPRPEDRPRSSARPPHLEPLDAVDAFDDASTDGPFAFIHALEEARPKIRAEAVLWFVGVVLVLAGSLYFTESNWDRWTREVRALVVTVGLVGYQAMFVGLAAFLAKRQAPLLPTRVFAGLGAALVAMVGWSSATLFSSAPVAALGLTTAASVLVLLAARSFGGRGTKMAVPAAATLIALTVCRSSAPVAAAAAAFALLAVTWSIWSFAGDRGTRIGTAIYGAYLAVAVTAGAATHGAIAAGWIVAPAIAWAGVVAQRFGPKSGPTFAVAPIIAIVTSVVSLVLALSSDIVPVAGRVAVLVTAALATRALWSCATNDDRRLPIALAVLSGLFVYFFLPAPFRAVMDLLLASAKSALGYDDRPLPIAYYGVTFVPYLLGWWIGSFKIRRSLASTVRLVAFVIAATLVTIAATSADPRPALLTLPIYALVLAIDARRTKNVLALHSACLLIIVFGVRLAIAAFGAEAWVLGLAGASALIGAFVRRRDDPTITWYAAATAGASLLAAFVLVHSFAPVFEAAAAATLATGVLVWTAVRSHRRVWAGAALIAAAMTGTIAFPEAPHVVAMTTTILTLALAFLRRGVFAEASRVLLPLFALVTIFIGLAFGATPIAHVPTVAIALVSPLITGRPIWSLLGAFGLAVLTAISADYFDHSIALPLALLAMVGFVAAGFIEASGRRLIERYDLIISAGATSIGLFAAAVASHDSGPPLALHIVVMLGAVLHLGAAHKRRRSTPTLRLDTPTGRGLLGIAIVITGLAVALVLPSPAWATAPVCAFALLIVQRTLDDVRHRIALLALAVSCVFVAWPDVSVLAIASATLLASARVPLALRLVAAGAALISAAAAFGPIGAAFTVGLGAPLSFGRDRPTSTLVVSVALALLAGVVLWPIAPLTGAVYIAPAVVLLAAPIYAPRVTATPLATGLGLVLAAYAAASLLHLPVAIPLTVATLIATIAARLWTLRAEVDALLALSDDDGAEDVDRYGTALTARLVAGAIGVFAIYAVAILTSFVTATSFAWVAVLATFVFAATGFQISFGVALVATVAAALTTAISFVNSAEEWVAIIVAATLSAITMVCRRARFPDVLVHRAPSPWVPTILALVAFALSAIGLLASIAFGSNPIEATLAAIAMLGAAVFLRAAFPTRTTHIHALLFVLISAGLVGGALGGWPAAAVGVAAGSVFVFAFGAHHAPFRTNRAPTTITYAGLALATLATRFSTHGFATAVVLFALTAAFSIAYVRRPRREVLGLGVLSAAASMSWLWFGVGRLVSTGRPELAILPFVALGFAVVAGLLRLLVVVWVPARARAKPAYVEQHFYRPLAHARYGLMIAATLSCFAHVSLMLDPSAIEVAVAGGIILTAVVYFARRARQHARTIDAVVVEGSLLLVWIFLRRQCGLFAGVPNVDAYGMMIAAFLFTGVHSMVQRGVLGAAYERAARFSALVLPLVAALLFEPDVSWQTAGVVGVVSLAYAVAARAGVSSIAAPLATVAFNVATIVAWLTAGIGDPQLYALPIGVSLLFLAHLYRDGLTPRALAWIRLVALAGVYLSSFVSVLSFDAPGQSLIMACICIAGAVAGLLLRVRSYLLLGAAFLVVDLGTSIVRFGLSGQTAATIVLTALGLALLGSLVVWSLNRTTITRAVESFGLELSEWEV